MEPKEFLQIPIIQEEICKNLNFGETINFRDALGLATLNCPITIRDPKSDQILVLPGVNPETIATYPLILEYGSKSAFRIAASRGHTDVVQTLLKIKIGVNEATEHGSTALMRAFENVWNETVKVLLAAGADVNLKIESGFTALMWASAKGNDAIVSILIEAKADVNAVDQPNVSALGYAACFGHVNTVKILLAAGADPTSINVFRLTAFDDAHYSRLLQITEILEAAINKILK